MKRSEISRRALPYLRTMLPALLPDATLGDNDVRVPHPTVDGCTLAIHLPTGRWEAVGAMPEESSHVCGTGVVGFLTLAMPGDHDADDVARTVEAWIEAHPEADESPDAEPEPPPAATTGRSNDTVESLEPRTGAALRGRPSRRSRDTADDMDDIDGEFLGGDCPSEVPLPEPHHFACMPARWFVRVLNTGLRPARLAFGIVALAGRRRQLSNAHYDRPMEVAVRHKDLLSFGLPKSGVSEAVQTLVKEGLLEVVEPSNGRHPTRYRLLWADDWTAPPKKSKGRRSSSDETDADADSEED